MRITVYAGIVHNKEEDLWEMRFSFPFDPATIAKIKQLPRARWSPENKEWRVPFSEMGLYLARALIPELVLDEDLQRIASNLDQRFKDTAKIISKENGSILPGLPQFLLPYQRTGVEFLVRCENAILADDMGVGKTMQAIFYATLWQPRIVLCPASVKYFWRDEISRCFPSHSVQVISGTSDTTQQDAEWTILNYDILACYLDALLERQFGVLLADEAHHCRTLEAIRTKAFLSIATRVPRVVCISGTPLINRPLDLFPLLVATKKLPLNAKHFFGLRYCGGHQEYVPIRGGRGRKRAVWKYNGSSNTEELKHYLKSFMIRRTRAEIRNDLPPMLRTILTVDLDNLDEYLLEKNEVLEWLNQEQAASYNTKLVRINALRMKSAIGKISMVNERLGDIKEAGEKAVVFSSFLKPLYALHNQNAESILFEGKMNERQRHEAVSRFQNDPDCHFAFCSLDAGGEGITLTAANHLFFLDLPWMPSKLAQGEARLQRHGQQRTVNVIYVLGKGTVDEVMARVLSRKAATIDAIVDDESAMKEMLEEVEQYLVNYP